MSPFVKPSTSPLGSVDAQRVEDALSLIAPKWTTWAVQALEEHGRPMRVRDVAARLPSISSQRVGNLLTTMQAAGLVTRTGAHYGAPFELSAIGASLPPVHHALARWSRTHLALGRMAGAARVEDAVRRLHLRHSTAVVQALGAGPTRLVDIAEQTDAHYVFAMQRLRRLEADGLVARTGPRHGDLYLLTDAGRALGPVYAAVEHWSNSVSTQANVAAPGPAAAAEQHRGHAPQRPAGPRSAMASRRSTGVPTALFSHAPAPQPRVPTAVTAQSAPARSR